MHYIGIDALIKQPTMDPAYVSVAEYVAAQQRKKRFDTGRVTPPALAELLERDCRAALRLVRGIDTSANPSLMYEIADIQAWAHLGLHLAEKLRGAVELQTFRGAGGEQHRRAAIAHLEKALASWDDVIRITRPIYKDMKLTAYNGNSFDANPNNLFHWARIRAEVARDLEVARASTPEPDTTR
jgi:hypothetical protein